MVDRPGEGRFTGVPLRSLMQSGPGTPWAPLIVAPSALPEARTADSINCFGCHRSVQFFFTAVSSRIACCWAT
jgi:hypothetical protein